MNNRFLFPGVLLFSISVLFFSCSPEKPAPRHHALIIMNHYQPLKEGGNTVIPYRVNLMALDLLGKNQPRYIRDCQYYIQWYLNHVNPFDKYDLSGTIYDYNAFMDGTETSLNYCGSIDNTSATFILLIHRFYKKTGFKKMLTQNRRKIQEVVYLIPHLQDHDGLIRSLPFTDRKFLANNCECYAAIGAYLELSREFGWGNEAFYEDVQKDIRTAISEHFYRGRRDEFYWLIDQKGKYAPDWNVFYPDSYSQLFPLLYRVMPGTEGKRMQRLWRKFQRFHGDKHKPGPMDVEQRLVYKWTGDGVPTQ